MAERASSRLVIAVVRVVVALMAVACRAEAARDQDPTPATSPPNERSEATIGIVEVSYRTAKHQRLVEVYVSGQGPFTFLIDTGVTGAAIDLDLARRLGIHLPGDKVDTLTSGASAGGQIFQTWIADLTVGSLRIDSLQSAALPLTRLGERLGEPLHGILGDGFLKRHVTRFDAVDQTLSFAPSMAAFATDVAAADYVTPLVISPSGDMPILQVDLGGRSFIATLDMGSSLGLEIFTPFAEELGLGHAVEQWEPHRILGGSLGSAIAYEGTVPRIGIGPISFTDVPTSITPPRADSGRKGNLGNQLWRDHVVILDYLEDQIVIRRKR